ncbi:hypothetical protein [Pseudomonas vancouverensis]|uniref:Uncharacterized protein n=1 Tax=Pseudomonas vancouverensis TaxID=95300 RepID=A0A1H2NLW1_PSEVA|nr:hypothetical protein [Pseudomonas vancouverensis]KAB0495206.1 hypothetical protein F7R09_16625 [Pseudomonas vancouverensis]TDB57033.1 hypothetical protein EIY72_27260 [Pseudomonas vancouverensis]SDV06065.1 hypothetical protein SAMN05216558_2484 [Pseudomonas vancouverensis]
MLRSIHAPLIFLCLLIPAGHLSAEQWRFSPYDGAASVFPSNSVEQDSLTVHEDETVSPKRIVLNDLAFDEEEFGLDVHVGASDVREDRRKVVAVGGD